ncbi:S8 family serine peptidase [Paenibacillus harenae]|uniref:S8 family serine peptidase n=1 Tax=Paenibacillus harenae TaxID=306543 RepID=UPI0003FC4497|nr:S8 family serine peptidase [Paenibacillus harenae]
MIKRIRHLVKQLSRRMPEHQRFSLAVDASRPALATNRLTTRLLRQSSAWLRARGPRTLLRRALLALLIGSVTLTGLSPAGPAAAAAHAAQAAAGDAAACAACADEEQPQSWLLKWRDPALAHELRGTEVLRRQDEAAVLLVRPAEEGADVQAWLRRLQRAPGVEYVHPNSGVHMLAHASHPNEAEGGSLSALPASNGEDEGSSPTAPINEAEGDKLPARPSLSETAGKARQPASSSSSETPAELSAAAAAVMPTANDPELAKQHYLDQIGVPKAWETVREQTGLTIAIVDTGVDLDHPDLKANLVEGANLVNPNEPPDDDNGHGTSVAGVIAAVGNNGIGVSGILQKAKIMPIKALDHHGDGTEQELGDAILYAVRAGAKIVVLSVGLHRYSPYMQDIVQYAESKGVLLVAAAGNDGLTFGSKAAVKYPAAYPTVLAVGGVKPDHTADPRSNPGSELDLVAPWNVYTTALGGLYKKEEGTSMSAPQAAAAAALVWARYSKLEPYQVRELLRQTAKDIGPAGADLSSGYGVLQIDQALQSALRPDSLEPNESMKTAARFPLNTQLSAVLQITDDHDWYRVDTPYDGTLTIHYEGLVTDGAVVPPVRMTLYTNGIENHAADIKLASRSIDFNLSKGQHLIHLELINQSGDVALPYLLTSAFTIKADDYEKNDRSYEAFTLQPNSQEMNGTFHQTADRDWFAVTFTQSGKLRLTLTTNTARIDPGLAMQRAGESLLLYDNEGEGETEYSPVITVTPGKYYIRVHNAISSEASPALGTYSLAMDYTPKYDDPNEPNDKSYEAFMVTPGTEYIGVIGSYADMDWFQYRPAQPSIVSMAVSGVPADIDLKLEVYDKRMKLLTASSTGSAGKLQTNDKLLQPDVYYVKLTADAPFDKQYYRMNIKSEELVAGFRDIHKHWAKNEIVELSEMGIINGTGAYRFEPKRAITRAEAVAMAVKAYKPAPQKNALTKRFKDVPAAHWASGAIDLAVQQGWVKGFPDGSFKPEQPVTRKEMAVIIGFAEGIEPQLSAVDPFDDVDRSDWSAPMLTAMKQRGLIEGVQSNLYEPKRQASRADFTVLLHRIIT